MHRGFLLNYTALGILCIGFGMLGYHINTFYKGLVFITDYFQNTSLLTFVFSGIYINGIALLDM
jgi:hypothetical protein